MIKNLTKTIAYICPFCSGVTQKQIGIFRFSGGRNAELLCSDTSCTEPCVTITQTTDKYKITVDCPICGEVHSYKISKSAFWNKDIFTFQCPNSAIDIFFIGTKAQVTKAVDENNDILESMADHFDDIPEDMNILFNILDDLHRILSEGRISCKCGGNMIMPDINDNGITLTCHDCGNSMLLSPTPDTIERLSGSGKFIF